MGLVIGEVASNMALAIHAGSMGLAWRPIQFRFFLKTLEEGKSRRSGCWTAPAPGKTYLWIPLSLQWSIEWCWIALKSCPNSIIPLPILLAAGARMEAKSPNASKCPKYSGTNRKTTCEPGKRSPIWIFWADRPPRMSLWACPSAISVCESMLLNLRLHSRSLTILKPPSHRYGTTSEIIWTFFGVSWQLCADQWLNGSVSDLSSAPWSG